MILNNKNQALHILRLDEAAEDWISYQKDREEHPELYALKSTGLVTLDAAIGGGIEIGQYVLVGGAQKSGKTTLLVEMFLAFVRQGVPSLFLGAEMSTRQYGTMIMSNKTGIERTRIRDVKNRVLLEEDWLKFRLAAKDLKNKEGFITHGFRTLEDIDTSVTRIHNETGITIKAIFGDYLQLMGQKGFRDRVSEIEYISRGIKQRSIEPGKEKAMIFATQINRASIRAGIYDANSFLGSGSQERDMDLGMLIRSRADEITGRPSKHEKIVKIVGARESEADDEVILFYDGRTATLDDNIISHDLGGNWQ